MEIEAWGPILVLASLQMMLFTQEEVRAATQSRKLIRLSGQGLLEAAKRDSAKKYEISAQLGSSNG